IPNRLSIQPMEGFDSKRNGSPSCLTFRRYKRYAHGGAGIIWCEATSILEEYKSNPHQLALTENNVAEFRKFVEFIKSESKKTLENLGFHQPSLMILQLNHSGRYCKKGDQKYPIRAYHNMSLDVAINVSKIDGKIISDEELNQVEDIWVSKALLAREAGFDGVDIKACHGYLISELLGARTRKDSIYGGNDLMNRSRLLLNIIKKLRKKIPKDDPFLISSRLGVYDGVPYPLGFGIAQTKGEIFPASIDLTEPMKVIKKLYELGVRLINISAGNPHYKPHITRPFDIPVKGREKPAEHPLCGVYRLIKMTEKIRNIIPPEMKIIGSGYSYLREFAPYVCAGLIRDNKVDICGFGRMAFANPNFPKQIFEMGTISKKSVCIACSQCSQLMKNGVSTGCVIRDSAYELKNKPKRRRII
ncbi:MAG: flavin oxidoreductase/NADH oxidase, partial [Promethearchaeia archaeon]